MNHYTPEDLQAKATAFLLAQNQDDERCMFVLILLCNAFNISPTDAQARIEKLAECGSC